MDHKEIEQEYELKDGRIIYKTDNGFKCYCRDKKGNSIEVTEAYYKHAFRLRKNK